MCIKHTRMPNTIAIMREETVTCNVVTNPPASIGASCSNVSNKLDRLIRRPYIRGLYEPHIQNLFAHIN